MLLGVNIDHVATLRQVRRAAYPDLVAAALEAERGGADFITAHLREDRRHIQDADVGALSAAIGTHLNLELAVTGEMVGIACAHRPRKACVVPERREELTTEGGLDVVGAGPALADAIARMRGEGIEVSLFVDPDPRQVEAGARAGADAVEIHTGDYANRPGDAAALARIAESASAAAAAGLKVNAGHGLTVGNVGPVASIGGLAELNIGHAIVARAVFVGLAAAVGEMRRAIAEARR